MPLTQVRAVTDWAELAQLGAALSEDRTTPEPDTAQGTPEASRTHRTEGAPRFVFRGASDAGQALRTTLDRCAHRVAWLGRRQELEDGLLHEFQRRAHHYASDLPPREASLEWLALMRHHGGPTRLLDWSYSFWVALFFALEDACALERPKTAAVWALDRDQVHRCHAALLSEEERELRRRDTHTEDPGTFARFYRQERRLVFFENPFRLNERLALQQGLFAINANVEGTFEEDLAGMVEAVHARSAEGCASGESPLLYRVDIPHALAGRVLRELHRMNISRATLFPGLDGFAQSLENMAFERHRLEEYP